MDLDLTEAIEAGRASAAGEYERRIGLKPVADNLDDHYVFTYADAAVRAAAPIIERAVLERVNAAITSAMARNASVVDAVQAMRWTYTTDMGFSRTDGGPDVSV